MLKFLSLPTWKRKTPDSIQSHPQPLPEKAPSPSVSGKTVGNESRLSREHTPLSKSCHANSENQSLFWSNFSMSSLLSPHSRNHSTCQKNSAEEFSLVKKELQSLEMDIEVILGHPTSRKLYETQLLKELNKEHLEFIIHVKRYRNIVGESLGFFTDADGYVGDISRRDDNSDKEEDGSSGSGSGVGGGESMRISSLKKRESKSIRRMSVGTLHSIQTYAKRIYDEFIKEGSVNEINIENGVRKRLIHNMSTNNHLNNNDNDSNQSFLNLLHPPQCKNSQQDCSILDLDKTNHDVKGDIKALKTHLDKRRCSLQDGSQRLSFGMVMSMVNHSVDAHIGAEECGSYTNGTLASVAKTSASSLVDCITNNHDKHLTSSGNKFSISLNPNTLNNSNLEVGSQVYSPSPTIDTLPTSIWATSNHDIQTNESFIISREKKDSIDVSPSSKTTAEGTSSIQTKQQEENSSRYHPYMSYPKRPTSATFSEGSLFHLYCILVKLFDEAYVSVLFNLKEHSFKLFLSSPTWKQFISNPQNIKSLKEICELIKLKKNGLPCRFLDGFNLLQTCEMRNESQNKQKRDKNDGEQTKGQKKKHDSDSKIVNMLYRWKDA